MIFPREIILLGEEIFINQEGFNATDVAKSELNYLKTYILGKCFEPFVKKTSINGIENEDLRDTSAWIDLRDSTLVVFKDLLGKSVWVRQPLNLECKCLPLEKVEIEEDFGVITTKETVKAAELNRGFYLMGNKTAQLIDEFKLKPITINGVETWSQAWERQRLERADAEAVSFSSDEEQEEKEAMSDEEVIFPIKSDVQSDVEKRELVLRSHSEDIKIPVIGSKEQSILSDISAEDFAVAQIACPSLANLGGKR